MTLCTGHLRILNSYIKDQPISSFQAHQFPCVKRRVIGIWHVVIATHAFRNVVPAVAEKKMLPCPLYCTPKDKPDSSHLL